MDQEQPPKKMSDSFFDKEMNDENPLHILNKKHGKKKYAHYQVLEKLGEGGMGAVYKVYDTVLNRELAIKVLLHEDIHFKKRFIREAKATALLDHPNIVKFYNLFTENESLCIVMQYIPGMQLQQYIKQKNPTLKQKLQIMATIIEAVDYAHKRNILHRDIKPENIIVSDAGIPYLTDFGIAKVTQTTEKSLTKTGTFMGTPDYMSPEQARGQFRELDARADVYSLGASLYEVVTETTLFPSMKISQAIYTILYEKPLPPSAINNELPKAIDHICFKAIAKDKKKRYATASDMAEEIKLFLNGRSVFFKRYCYKFYKLQKIAILLLLGCTFFLFYNKMNTQPVNNSIERTFFSNITKMIADEKYEETEKLLDRIFSISQKKQNAHGTYYFDMLSLYMAICLIEKKSSKEIDKNALTFLKKAKKGLPKEPKVYEYLGLYYIRSGDLANALLNLKKSVNLQPYSSKIHYYIGKTLSLQNKDKLAQKSFLRALELNALNFKAFEKLYDEAVKYPHLQYFAHYHSIAINYTLSRFPAPDIFQDVCQEISRENYINYFYWRNGLFDKITSQINEIYYYRFANLQDLHIQKELQSAIKNSPQEIKNVSSTTVKNFFLGSSNIIYRYLAARALLHTRDFYSIFKYAREKNPQRAIISLCALHAQGIPIKMSPQLSHAIEKENNVILQTLLAQNIKKLNIKQLKIWMTNSDKKLQLCAAANIFNQENVNENLKIEAKNILVKHMDSKNIVLSRYAHYHFWKSLYSKKYGNKFLYLKGLNHSDQAINTMVLRHCRIFDKKSLALYTKKYLRNKKIGPRSLNLAYALGRLDSNLVQNIIDDPRKPLLLRILSQHIMIFTRRYFQKNPVNLILYLYKNQDTIEYKNHNMRIIHYAYLAATFSYRITYDFTHFFEHESKLVQQSIMYNLRCASPERTHLSEKVKHHSKIKWVKKYLDDPSPQIKRYAWAAWTIMSKPERTTIFKKASNSEDLIRKGAAYGFYNIFYFSVRRYMPDFTERMTSLQNFDELYYEYIAKMSPTLLTNERKMLEKSLSRSINLDPKISRYYYDRAIFSKAQKKDLLAKKDLKKAMDLNKNNPRYLLTFAQFLPLGKPSTKLQIQSILPKVLSHTNNNTIIQKTGQLYLKIGMYNKAKEIFWKLYLQNPTDVKQNIFLVKTYWMNNEKEKAKELLYALIEIEKDYLKYVNSYRVKKSIKKITKPFLKSFLPELPNIDSFIK